MPKWSQTARNSIINNVLFVALIPVIALLVGRMTSGMFTMVNVQIFGTQFLSIFIEGIPFLLIGTILSGVIEIFVRPESLIRFIPRGKISSAIAGTFFGVLFPVCECGVVPVVRRLLRKGMPLHMGIAMLLAAPIVNPIALLSTYAAYGWGTVLIGRFSVAIVTAIVSGLLVSRSGMKQILPDDDAHDHARNPRREGIGRGIVKALSHSANEFFEVGFYFTVGCLLATAMQHALPQSTLLSLGTGPALSVAVMQLTAYILSICSSVDAFVSLGFAGTFSTGAIVAFLTFGAMIDIKSTMLFLSVFRRRTVLVLLLVPLCITFASGLLINLLQW